MSWLYCYCLAAVDAGGSGSGVAYLTVCALALCHSLACCIGVLPISIAVGMVMCCGAYMTAWVVLAVSVCGVVGVPALVRCLNLGWPAALGLV